MYAIVQTGGKQYRVEEGRTLRVEKLPVEKGGQVLFEQVLLVSSGGEVRVGTPFVNGCLVRGKAVSQGRSRKVIVFKYKAKKNYRRKQGHRQPFTEVLVEKIELNS